MHRTILFAGLLPLVTALHAAETGGCKLNRIAEWPVRLVAGRPMVEGAINGQRVNVLVHTAAYASLVTKSAAQRFGLAPEDTGRFAFGNSGQVPILVARVNELRVGDFTARNILVRVKADDTTSDVDLILGDDFLGKFDVELDYAGGMVRVFQPVGCDGVDIGYWDHGARKASIERRSRDVVPIVVNGRAARARIDSSSPTSFVDLAFAEKIGLKPGSAKLQPGGCSERGTVERRLWVGEFDGIAIGDQATPAPRLYVTDQPAHLAYSDEGVPDVVLGNDFLSANRVLISRSQERVYFSPLGGQAFRPVASSECERDPDFLLRRAAARIRSEPMEAIAVADKVIAMQSSNAAAYGLKADAHSSLKDYPAALADIDAAIARGLRTANAFAARAFYRRMMGDYTHVMEDYDEALRIDPRHAPSLRTRGRLLYHAGRYGAAQRDFTAVLAVRPSAFDSIWLSFARMRQGMDGRAELDKALTDLKQGDWPAPVVNHLLGGLDRTSLLSRALDPDPKLRREHECEALYYSAARLLIEGDRDQAKPLLERAVADCPATFMERESAVLDLQAMR